MTKKLFLFSILATTLFLTASLVFAATTAKVKKTADLACMQSAVEKRDSAMISAWDKLSSAVKSALETRKVALKDAWSKTDKTERVAAIRKAWSDYKTAIKSARQTFAKEKRAVWQQWKTNAKNCAGNAEDKTTESVDNSL